MPTKTLSWGENLGVDVDRWLAANGRNHKQLVQAANIVERGTQNTYRKVLKVERKPTRYEDQIRAYVTALIIDKDPAEYGLRIIRPVLWPDDDELRRIMQDALLGGGSTIPTLDVSAPDLRRRAA